MTLAVNINPNSARGTVVAGEKNPGEGGDAKLIPFIPLSFTGTLCLFFVLLGMLIGASCVTKKGLVSVPLATGASFVR